MEYRDRTEWKLGLFIAGGIVLFAVLIFTISNLNFFQKGYALRVLFRFANGIESGAPVRLAGVRVGEVKNVSIIYGSGNTAPVVDLELNIRSNIKIKQNSKVLINTLGLLGEKYIEILPGVGNVPYVKNGDIIVGQDTVPLSQVADLGYKIALKLDKTIDALKDIFAEEGQTDIKNTLTNFKALSINLNKLVLDTDQIVDSINKGKGTLGKLFSDNTLYFELQDFVQDIKRHPWKLLIRTRERKKDNKLGNRGYIYKNKKK